METSIRVPAEVRTSRGKNEARRTRMAGKIPAVVYGAFKDSVAIAVDPRAITTIIRSATGYNTIFHMDIPGEENTPVMLVDHQNDPVKGNLLHADFKRIDLSKRIKVSVPVLVVGESKGVKNQGGLLEVVTRSLEIECLPNEIPSNFTLEVTEMMLGESRRASDIPLAGSMKLLSAPDTVLVHVAAPRGEEEAAAETAEAVAEPEVVKKGKKEEEAEAEKGKEGKKK
ncbi:MAG TPA: 50S ribosomal protein L25 [Bryobacteraceae bacterium]|nr:50S ribosomal protein L25 [Bryobacteraceae bacterium]